LESLVDDLPQVQLIRHHEDNPVLAQRQKI